MINIKYDGVENGSTQYTIKFGSEFIIGCQSTANLSYNFEILPVVDNRLSIFISNVFLSFRFYCLQFTNEIVYTVTMDK